MKNIVESELFELHLVRKGNLADSSIYNYKKAVEQFLKDDPDVKDAHAYNNFLVKVMGKNNKRGTFYFAALKHFIKYRFNQDVADKMIARLIRPQDRDPKTSRIYLDKEKRVEILNYLYSLNEKYFIIALIQMQTGVRIGDILKLEIGGINWEKYNGKLVLRFDIIGKRQKHKPTYITNPDMAKIVWGWIVMNGLNIKKEEIKLLDENPTHYFLDDIKIRKETRFPLLAIIRNTARNYRNTLKVALKACDVNESKFSSHDWRRCFSRDNYTEFNDIVLLQNVLGHSSISTTSRYLRHSGLDTLQVLEKMQN